MKVSKAQIAVRIPQSLSDRLNNYVKRTGMSKTDVVAGAIANYLGCEEDTSLHNKVNEMHKRLTELEIKLSIIQ